jgi:hypothetical protein
MHFVDAWTNLPPLGAVLLLAPAAIAIIAVLLPGRPLARTLSIAVALTVPLSPGLGPLEVRASWLALWLGVALVSGVKRDVSPRAESARPGGVESGAIGLLLGGGWLALMVVALGRQDLPQELTRAATLGMLLVSVGLVHLLFQRDALRGAMAFATIGLGLQWLDAAVRLVVLESGELPRGAVLFATAVAVVLASRVAFVRQNDAGSAWVSHAHDLHD